jgi:hypothetical protein
MNKYLKAKLDGKDVIITYVTNDLSWVLATYDLKTHKKLFKLDTSKLAISKEKLERLIKVKYK